jgi:hypothetical protein
MCCGARRVISWKNEDTRDGNLDISRLRTVVDRDTDLIGLIQVREITKYIGCRDEMTRNQSISSDILVWILKPLYEWVLPV